jgi:hypothetical protein
MTVRRAEYDRQDCWTLTLPTDRSVAPADQGPRALPQGAEESDRGQGSESGPWHIRVYSLVEREGTTAFSPGIEASAATVLPGPHPEVTVSYVLKRPWVPGLPWSVTFRTEPPGSAIPPMVLVAHPRAIPLSVDDGQIVTRFPNSQDKAHFSIRTRVNLASHGIRAFPDPAVRPDALVPIRLRHPETGATRV